MGEAPGFFPGGHRPLRADELAAFLEGGFWGVLTTVWDGAPYGVPVIYGWDGRDFYVLMLPGRKADCIDRNPRVSLTIVDPGQPGHAWRSVVVTARVEWVQDLLGRVTAVNVLRRQMAGRRAASVRDVGRLARARIARLIPGEITGRTAADG